MVAQNNKPAQNTDTRAAFTARFPRALYKTLRRHCVELELSINAYLVIAVEEKLTRDNVSLP